MVTYQLRSADSAYRAIHAADPLHPDSGQYLSPDDWHEWTFERFTKYMVGGEFRRDMLAFFGGEESLNYPFHKADEQKKILKKLEGEGFFEKTDDMRGPSDLS